MVVLYDFKGVCKFLKIFSSLCIHFHFFLRDNHVAIAANNISEEQISPLPVRKPLVLILLCNIENNELQTYFWPIVLLFSSNVRPHSEWQYCKFLIRSRYWLVTNFILGFCGQVVFNLLSTWVISCLTWRHLLSSSLPLPHSLL